jgi:hypothetical protein
MWTMTDLIEQLADLAQLRDVDALDTAMCKLAQRCLDTEGVAIHRLVNDGGCSRWLTTGQMDLATGQGTLGELPTLDERPIWRDGLLALQALPLTEGQHRTVFPLADRRGGQGVMELHSGEEFVVLLRCPHAQATLAVFERLRLRIGTHDFPQVGRLTVSIGYTAIDADDTPGLAFERADLAVYQAKQEGRNRTLSHADLAIPQCAEPARGALEFF